MSPSQALKGFLRIPLPPNIYGPTSQCRYASTSDSGRKPKMGSTSQVAPSLTSMKRGPGFRSSFSGTVATIFGANGMVGRGVCNRLGQNGTQMIIPYRGDHYDVRKIKVCGDLGQVLFSPYDLRDEESIRKAIKYSNVVINLIGREFETRNFSFKDVNVTGPARLARIAREEGAERFIHISSINARENPKTLFLPGGSEWLRTKWQGEKAVLEEFPDATIFRASEIYCQPDHFIDYYNIYLRRGKNRHHMPLWKRGSETVKAPLWGPDLTTGIMTALDDASTKGVTFDAMGPERFILADLMDWMHEVMHKDPVDWGYRRTDLRLDPVCFAKAMFSSYMPFGNKYWRAPTLERLERTQLTDEPVGLPTLSDLGVKLHTVEDKMPWELDVYRAFRFHIYLSDSEKPQIHPLKPISRLEEKQLHARLENNKNMLQVLGLTAQ